MVRQRLMVVGVRFLIVIGCAFATGFGCKTTEPQAFSDEFIRASVAPLEGVLVGDELLRHYVQKRTAYLLSGIDLPEGALADNSFEGRASPSGKVFFGSAAAVDRRGYFVTAAHCVEDNPDVLRLVFSHGGKMQVKSARIVYMGNPSTDHSDFAVVHTAIPLSAVFNWADDFQAGDKLMCLGTRQNGDTSSLSFETVVSGGAIQRIENPRVSGRPFQIIRHSAPIFYGNSGGPAVATDGQLVGVNFSVTFSNRPIRQPRLAYSSTIRPKLNWLQEIIEKDARSQNR